MDDCLVFPSQDLTPKEQEVLLEAILFFQHGCYEIGLVRSQILQSINYFRQIDVHLK
jgi:hypothetical protein